MTAETMNLRSLLEKTADPDFLREMFTTWVRRRTWTDWSASPTANHRTPPSKARHHHYPVERHAQVQIFINRQHMPARLNCRWYPVVF